ncbi:MAG: HYR domain-containing protein, partial [Nocardioidaceae bacterium]|nr:HYR domain-containing protein [Nocardioidaceae bacterium]
LLAATCHIAAGAAEVASGDTFALGTTQVTCKTVDAWFGSATGTFQIAVQDTTAPTITVPEDITVEATSAEGAQVTFNATAHDAVHGDLPANCDRASGSTFALGSTTVTCTAADPEPSTPRLFRPLARGTASASFVVRVLEPAAAPEGPADPRPADVDAAGLPATGAPALAGPLALAFGLLFAGVLALRRRRA